MYRQFYVTTIPNVKKTEEQVMLYVCLATVSQNTSFFSVMKFFIYTWAHIQNTVIAWQVYYLLNVLFDKLLWSLMLS